MIFRLLNSYIQIGASAPFATASRCSAYIHNGYKKALLREVFLPIEAELILYLLRFRTAVLDHHQRILFIRIKAQRLNELCIQLITALRFNRGKLTFRTRIAGEPLRQCLVIVQYPRHFTVLRRGHRVNTRRLARGVLPHEPFEIRAKVRFVVALFSCQHRTFALRRYPIYLAFTGIGHGCLIIGISFAVHPIECGYIKIALGQLLGHNPLTVKAV